MFCQKISFKIMLHMSKTMMFQSLNIQKNVIRSCSSMVDTIADWNKLKLKYTENQQSLMLEVLTKCNIAEMKKYGLSESFAKSLKTSSNGIDFKSLDDFIEFNLLKVSELDAICSAIAAKKLKSTKKQSIVTPPVKKDSKINTAVGLRIGLNHISWTQLTMNGNFCDVLKCNCQNITDLPLNATPIEMVQIALKIADAIPDADAYVLERGYSRSVAKLNTTMVKLMIRQQQILSVILTVLYKKKRNEEVPLNNELPEMMYMMKAHAPAKHFDLYLDHETVSANRVIQELFQQRYSGLHNISSLIVNDDIEKYYRSLDNYLKEELSMCLLLTLTFFDLAVL